MNSTKNKNYALPIVMMILLFGMISFVTNLAAPMGVVLKNQFGVSNFLGMLGNFANFIAYAVMGIPAGKLLEKIGYKKTALLAILIGITGVGVQVLSGSAASFAVYLSGAFVAGLSMCMLNTVVNPMLNTLGGGGNKGNQLIQVGGSFNSLMGTLVPILVGALIGEVTKANITDVYPIMYMAIGIFALVGTVLFFVNIPEPHITKKDSSLSESKYSAWSFRHFVLGAIAIGVYVGIEVGIPGTMMLFIADPATGVVNGASSAGVVAGMYWLLMLVGRFTGASIAGKVSSKTMLMTASGVGMVLVALAIFSPVSTQISVPVIQTDPSISFGMAEVPINVVFLILCGLCTSIMWGGIFNLAVEGLGKYVPLASGIFMTMVCGGGIFPLIQNAVADAAGYLTSYWVPFLGLAYLLYYALIGSKNVNKNIPTE